MSMRANDSNLEPQVDATVAISDENSDRDNKLTNDLQMTPLSGGTQLNQNDHTLYTSF